jgi:hypothetical protein
MSLLSNLKRLGRLVQPHPMWKDPNSLSCLSATLNGIVCGMVGLYKESFVALFLGLVMLLMALFVAYLFRSTYDKYLKRGTH